MSQNKKTLQRQNPLKEAFSKDPIFSSLRTEQEPEGSDLMEINTINPLAHPPSTKYLVNNPILTSEQIEKIINDPKEEEKLYEKIRSLGSGAGTAIVVKSIRNDHSNFWRSFLMGITETEQLSKGFSLKDIRRPLRTERNTHKPRVKVTSRGIVRSSAPPQFTKEQKEGTSKKQSATLVRVAKQQGDQKIHKDFVPPVFGWNKKDRADALTGVIFFSQDIHNDPNLLISNVLKYDGGTYERPNEFYEPLSILDALWYKYKKKYHPTMNPNGVIFTGPEQLFRGASDQDYNESLIRMKFTPNDPRYQLGIFSNNLKSKLIAQFRAVDVKVNCNTQFVPISFYIKDGIDGNPDQKLCGYKLEDQKKDLLEALNSSDPELKAMGQLISIYNKELDPSNISINEKRHILSLMDMDQITSVTKTELLQQIFGINLGLELNVWENAIISDLIVKDMLYYKSRLLNPDLSSYYQQNLLNIAVTYRNLDIFNTLLHHHWDVNLTNNQGYTALIIAASGSTGSIYMDIIQKLLDNGADLNIQDKNGKTALMHAVAITNIMDIVQKLLDNGADLNIQDKDGKTALMYAVTRNRMDIVQKLLDNGADLNIQDKDGKTALMHAFTSNRMDIVQRLLDNGADLNIMDKDGKTALMHATEKNNQDIMRKFSDQDNSPKKEKSRFSVAIEKIKTIGRKR